MRATRIEFAAASRERVRSEHMYATVRRYDGIDKVRSEEVTRKAGESLWTNSVRAC